MDDLDDAWKVVHEAILAFGSKVPDLGKARVSLLRVIESGAWRHYAPPVGRPCEPPTFREWVTAAVPRGLETTEANLYAIAEGNAGLASALDQAYERKPRADKIIANVDNINVSDDLARPDGTSRRAALRRLRKDRPDLHEKVAAGELSAHAAMIQAGFRSRTISVPASRPESIARALRKHLNEDDLAALVQLLSGTN